MNETHTVRLILAGDVMTGRGIDQIQPTPSDPELYEGYVRDARDYVALAERANGPVPRAVEPGYIWGDAVPLLQGPEADLRIINLETAVTTCDEPWPDKAVHYRMHPANIDCLQVAAPDCCVLANNHVLDWGRPGLEETLDTLQEAGLCAVGAGHDTDGAQAPAVLACPQGGRVLVFAAGHRSSGVPGDWAADAGRCGVHYLPDLLDATIDRLGKQIAAVRQPGDQVVLSIHWGSNWGYPISQEQTAFARGVIDRAGVDLVHGHSSHHPRALEVHRGRLILYGCGDLLNDYEGIGGHEAYRSDLSLLYIATLQDGRLAGLQMVPLQIRHLRLNHAATDDARWLAATMDREARRFGGRVSLAEDSRLHLFVS
ncbi:CapA family protein [Thioalkalivibrio thiocyanoxidans]|uniref:CapA family protein n=1 Tax=Thioalkalivibrio thiocyanoxidans TaxID=152475 RepID=UPI00036095D9|nr:CapA family protein [Thioalkalivibrio thiocyanoxidans]